MGTILFYIVFAVAGIAALNAARRSGRFFLCVFLTALQGLAALFAVNVLGSFLNIHININAISLAVSGVFGTAGVILMLLVNTFIAK